MIEKIWTFLVEWGESIHRARVATALSRIGEHEKAKKIMLDSR